MTKTATRTLATLALTGATALLAACASAPQFTVHETANCISDAQMQAWMADFDALRPAANPAPGTTMADAACMRAKMQRALAQQGQLVGYKAGLTNPAVQAKFNTDAPVWGALFSNMLLDDGAVVDAAFGARPLYEADMLVRVADAGINDASTPAEVLAHVDQVIPFIELPDLAVQEPGKLDGAAISAINVGTRLGVRGTPLAVPADAAAQARLLDELRDMQVRLTDAQGNQLGGGTGSDVLQHPLNAVVWLAGALREQGLRMEPGQLISLGSFSALLPPKAGLDVTASYGGVTGLQPVSVSFR